MATTIEQRKSSHFTVRELRIDLLSIPPNTDDFVFLDYDPLTLRLRYLARRPGLG